MSSEQYCPNCPGVKFLKFIEFRPEKSIMKKCPKCDLCMPEMDIPVCLIHNEQCHLVYNGRNNTLAYKCPISVCSTEVKVSMEGF